MNSKTEHTPTPWEFEDIGEEDDNLRINQWERMEASKVSIAIIPVGYSEPFESEQRANAAFILEACNTHSTLLSRLDALRAGLEDIRALICAVPDDSTSAPAYRGCMRAIEKIDALLEQRT